MCATNRSGQLVAVGGAVAVGAVDVGQRVVGEVVEAVGVAARELGGWLGPVTNVLQQVHLRGGHRARWDV